MKTAVPGLIIRSFQLNDLRNIYLLSLNDETFSSMDHAWEAEYLAELLSGDDVKVFTAARKKETAGFIMGRSSGNTAVILRILVKERYRRKGIGTALITMFRENSGKAGIHDFSAALFPENPDLETFFCRNNLTRKENFTRLSGKI